MMTAEQDLSLILKGLFCEIDREIDVLNATAGLHRADEERCAGTTGAYRANGKAVVCEVEADRLTAILAKYQAVTA